MSNIGNYCGLVRYLKSIANSNNIYKIQKLISVWFSN